MSPHSRFRMFLISCLALVISFPLVRTWAQWSPDPSTNLQVCDVTGEQSIPKIANTGDGGTYACWFDNRSGSYAVYLQRLDSLGMKQFAPDGLLISAHPQNSWLVDYDLDVDQNDNAVIVFSDIRGGGDFNPVAYKISPQGAFLWGPNGVTLSDSVFIFQATPRVRVTTDGSAVCTWFFGSSPARVAMQRLSPGGAKEWGEEPILLSGSGTENFEYPSLVASDSGSVILLWCGFTGSFLNPQNYRLYTQKFSPAATPLWGSAPDTVYNLGRVPGFFFPVIAPDGLEGALYGWHDDRNMTNLSTSYVQHLTVDGTHLFPPNGAAVSTLGGRNHFDVSMAYDPATGETYAAWLETNEFQTLMGTYGQKFSATGARLWGETGLPLLPLSGNAQAYITVSVWDTAAIIWWVDLFSGGVNNAVRGMKLDRQGVRLWGDSVRTVSSAPDEKLHLVTTIDSRGLSKLAWGDRRTDGGGIYAQCVWPNGELGNPLVAVEEQTVPGVTFALLQCYPNPFNGETRIGYRVWPARTTWSGGGLGSGGLGSGGVQLVVYDVLGRRVARLVDGPVTPGDHEVVFEASGLPSGVYFYTLQAGSFRETKRMIVLK